MSLGSRIKERREQLNLSRNELAERIGVTSSAIANYENEISSPKIELMYKLFNALGCDANYLHQDDMNALIYENTATPEEFEKLVKKYRVLDPHGKKMVDFTLNEEWERSTTVAKENAEKAKQNLVSISKYTKEGENENNTEEFSKELILTKDYLLPNAAHADESLTEITEEMIQAEEDIMDDENF